MVVKNGTKRFPVFDNPGPSSSTHNSIVGGDDPGSRCQPTLNAAAGFADGVDGVANQVDEELFELIAVSLDRHARTWSHADVMCLLERGDAIDEPRDVERHQLGRRQLRQAGVGAHETAERFGSGPDDGEPTLDIVAPVGRRRLPFDDRREAAGDRLDRRERVVHLVPDDANQPLPGLAFFLAQRLTEVREHQQLVRPPTLAEEAAPDFPAADAAGKRRGDDARCLAAQALVEVEVGGTAPEEAFRRLAQKARAGAVHELQLVLLVEGEDRHIDLRHHFSEQGSRLEGVQALVPQRLDEGVDLDHDLAQGVASAGAARAD